MTSASTTGGSAVLVDGQLEVVDLAHGAPVPVDDVAVQQLEAGVYVAGHYRPPLVA